jgi:hypothetical protein
MAYNPEMEKLKKLQLLTQQIAGQYGGGNDVQSVNTQNNAAVEGMRAQGMTDAQIAQAVPTLPWNDQSRAIPAQMPQAAPQMPAQAPVAAPAQMPAPAQAQQAKPSFFQRMGQRFDQAATGGVIDPTTLTKDQRRILRGQLLMNVGGALSQNRPIGEGFQQQYNALTKQKAEQQALQARKAVSEAFAGGIGNREQFMGVVKNLFASGQYEQGMELLSKADDFFKTPKYSTEPREFVRKDTGERFTGVLSDTGDVKTLTGLTIPAEQVFIAVPEGGSVFSGDKNVPGGALTPVATRPKSRKVVDERTGPDGTKYVQYEDGSIEKKVF